MQCMIYHKVIQQ